MRLSKHIKKSAVLLGMASSGKDEALGELVDLLCGAYGLRDRDTIHAAILSREEKQSTGLVDGLAVPHAKTEAVDRLYVAFGLSREGIAFDSADGRPARLFFILVSPKDVSGPHIKALAGISRLIKHEDFRDSLMSCGSDKEFVKLVTEAEKKYL